MDDGTTPPVCLSGATAEDVTREVCLAVGKDHVDTQRAERSSCAFDVRNSSALVDERIDISLQWHRGRDGSFGVRAAHRHPLPLLIIATMSDTRKNVYYSMGWYRIFPGCTAAQVSAEVRLDRDRCVPCARSVCQRPELPAHTELSVRSFASYTVGWSTLNEVVSTFQAGEGVPASEDGVAALGGEDGMALFWSLRPLPKSRLGLRYAHRDVRKPMRVQLGAYIVSKGADADEAVLSLVAQHHVDRWYLERGCKRIEVRSPCGVRGTLFIPASISNGEGETYASSQPEREQRWIKKRGECLNPHPLLHGGQARGVVDMFGTAGGLLEFRAALLASHGFVALALAFFDFQDLPKAMHGITVEYFLNAIEWLRRRPEVATEFGIGISGVSYGGELALLLSTLTPHLRSVVGISPSNVNTNTQLLYKGEVVPFVECDYAAASSNEVVDAEGNTQYELVYVTTWDKARAHPQPEEVVRGQIPVERTDAHILLLSGADDMDWPSADFSEHVVHRMQCHGKSHLVKHFCYFGAGHLIEPPYSAFCRSSYHKVIRCSLAWGGSAPHHAVAQVRSWREMLNHFDETLRPLPASL